MSTEAIGVSILLGIFSLFLYGIIAADFISCNYSNKFIIREKFSYCYTKKAVRRLLSQYLVAIFYALASVFWPITFTYLLLYETTHNWIPSLYMLIKSSMSGVVRVIKLAFLNEKKEYERKQQEELEKSLTKEREEAEREVEEYMRGLSHE